MDLRNALVRWGIAHPRVLLVDAPGSRALRWRVEAELDRRHWPLAVSPADADLLLVLGAAGPELSAAVDLLWRQTPAPRHRQHLAVGDVPGPVLDAAAAALLDAAGDRGTEPPDGPWPEGRGPHSSGSAGMDHGMDAGMDHGMHHGGEVAGLEMAGTAPDRDGLELDSLRVSLGPVLPAWPTGLVLRGALQGDVLTDVAASWADGQPATTGDDAAAGTAPQCAALDSLSRFLVVAGWPTAAREARTARSGLRSPDPSVADRARRDASRLARRVQASRSLAWSVRGIGACGDGDVLTRVGRWCDLAAGVDATPAPGGVVALSDLTARVEGAELASVRLVVASVDLEPAPLPLTAGETARA